MKAVICGELKCLRASEKLVIEKLAAKRGESRDIVDSELAKRVSSFCSKLNVQIGLLIARDGRITHVILGTKDRIYIPDLGRFRLEKARLRRLRLVVFVPDGKRILQPCHVESITYRRGKVDSERKTPGVGPISPSIGCPRIARDLLTDLDKLRFDVLMVVAVLSDGLPGPVSIAHIETLLDSEVLMGEDRKQQGERGVRLIHHLSIYDIQLNFEQFIDELESRLSSVAERGFATGKERAILVGGYTESESKGNSSMAELRELARTAGIEVVDTVIQRRRSLDSKTVIGKGKIEDLVLHCLDLGVELLVFDRELSPAQLRVITNITELRVIDRSMLILDIFAQHAVTSDGRVQVELAQLKYSLPRLTERDSGLSRLTGGIGGRGPGETKLEVGRRRARKRIADLEKRIDKLSSQRALRRERRQQRGVPVIAIVGYTNAGKSTLLNALTKAQVLVESKLFATLDPSSKRMRFPNEKEVVFVDTVGFIRELPKELVVAFRATLEEVLEADVLIHLVDAADSELREHIEVVKRTLESLGMGSKPRLLVLNKVDCLKQIEADTLVNSLEALPISAIKRQGFDVLIGKLQNALDESV